MNQQELIAPWTQRMKMYGQQGAAVPQGFISNYLDFLRSNQRGMSSAPQGGPEMGTAPQAGMGTAPQAGMSAAPQGPSVSAAPQGPSLGAAPPVPGLSAAPQGPTMSAVPRAPGPSPIGHAHPPGGYPGMGAQSPFGGVSGELGIGQGQKSPAFMRFMELAQQGPGQQQFQGYGGGQQRQRDAFGLAGGKFL
jgi:hypothetical protein